MKNFQINLLLLIIFSSNLSFGQETITSQDLQKVIGDWEGSLTYLDYQTNKPFTMPANLIVKQGKNENRLVLNNIYPDEPKANGAYKIKIAKNGHLLNKHVVTSRKIVDDGVLRIETEHRGRDNKKRVNIRYTYLIDENIFAIRKEVQFEKIGIWIKRSEFNYKRKT